MKRSVMGVGFWLYCIGSAFATPYIYPSKVSIFHEACSLFEQRTYTVAQSYQEHYLSSHGKKYQQEEVAYYRILAALMYQDPHVETLVQYFMTTYPKHACMATLHHRLAQAFSHTHALEKSLSWYQKVNTAQLLPYDRITWCYDLANTYWKLKDYLPAKKYFMQLQEPNHPCYGPAKLRLATMAFEEGQYAHALAILKEIPENQNYLKEIHRLRVHIYYQAEQFESLLTYVKNAPENSFSKQDQLLIADSHFFLRQYEAAVPYYQNYLTDHGGDDTTVLKLVDGLYRLQQYAQVKLYLQPLLHREGYIGQMAAYYSGLIYEKEGAHEAALAAFSKAVKEVFDPQIGDLAALKRITLYYQQGMMGEAIQAACDFIEANPSSNYLVKAQFLLVQCYYKAQAYREAIHFIATLPYKDEALLSLYQKVLFYQGLASYNHQDFQEAIHYLKQSLHFPLKPTLVLQAKFWLAEGFSQLSLHEKALKYYRQLMEQNKVDMPYYEKILYGLAYAHFNRGHYEDAAKIFQQYIAFSEKHPAAAYYDAMLRLGDCYYVAKNYRQALAQYETVYAYHPAHVRYQEALIYQLLGDHVGATTCLQEVIAHHRHTAYYEKARYQQACMLFNEGHYKEAIGAFTDLIQETVINDLQLELLMKRALTYENLQKHQEASADYIAILECYPTHIYAEHALMALSNLLTKPGTSNQIAIDKYLNKQAPSAAALRSDLQTMDRAKQFFDHQAYDRVIGQLYAFATQYPKSPLCPEAYFLVAESHHRLGKQKQALSWYKKVAATNHALTKKALLRIADIAYQSRQYQTALHHYQQLEALQPDHKTHLRASVGIMQASFCLKQYPLTILTCSKLLDQELPIEIRQQAQLHLGKVALAQSAYKKASTHFLKANLPPHTPTAAEAQYLLAFVTTKLKNYQASLNSLFTLIAKYPHNKPYIDKAYVLMADNYALLGKLDQAKATLDSIINQSKDSQTVAIAKRKKSEIMIKLKKV